MVLFLQSIVVGLYALIIAGIAINVYDLVYHIKNEGK
jgi:hypothetical protein